MSEVKKRGRPFKTEAKKDVNQDILLNQRIRDLILERYNLCQQHKKEIADLEERIHKLDEINIRLEKEKNPEIHYQYTRWYEHSRPTLFYTNILR